jgi:hypothetical protein
MDNLDIVTCIARQRDNNKRGFSGFNKGVYLNYFAEITHNRYNTQFRVL